MIHIIKLLSTLKLKIYYVLQMRHSYDFYVCIMYPFWMVTWVLTGENYLK